MSIKQIRLSSQAKDQLTRLKAKTGIGQWNILCRWAFCLSLRQPAPPTPVEVPAEASTLDLRTPCANRLESAGNRPRLGRSRIKAPADSNVEMTWQVFGGEVQELYLAVLKERCERDGLGTSDEVLARQFRLHLHRGIGYLATPHA